MYVISWIRQYLLLILGVLTATVGVLLNTQFGCETVSATGVARQNPGEGEAVIYDRRPPKVSAWSYGETALFQSPRDASCVHRGTVVGIAGDTVGIRNGSLVRNGESLPEALRGEGYDDMPEILVPANCLYIVGSPTTPDSRRYGPVSVFAVRGKIRE